MSKDLSGSEISLEPQESIPAGLKDLTGSQMRCDDIVSLGLLPDQSNNQLLSETTRYEFQPSLFTSLGHFFACVKLEAQRSY